MRSCNINIVKRDYLRQKAELTKSIFWVHNIEICSLFHLLMRRAKSQFRSESIEKIIASRNISPTDAGITWNELYELLTSIFLQAPKIPRTLRECVDVMLMPRQVNQPQCKAKEWNVQKNWTSTWSLMRLITKFRFSEVLGEFKSRYWYFKLRNKRDHGV